MLKIVTHCIQFISIVYMNGQTLTNFLIFLQIYLLLVSMLVQNCMLSVIDNLLKDLGIIMFSNCSFEQHIIELL